MTRQNNTLETLELSHPVDNTKNKNVANRAIQIPIDDPALQAYLQKYPFGGPNLDLNALARREVAARMYLRPEARAVEIVLLKPAQTRLAFEEENRVVALLGSIGLNEEQKRTHLNDFAWEANMLPRDAKNVLVIGCGDGIELLFLRAALPGARITALNYHQSLLPGVQEKTGISFVAGDMNKLLPTFKSEYDLVYSNHTLEHLYSPDETLKVIANLIVPQGRMVSVLPMVGRKGAPFLEKLREFLSKRDRKESAEIHPMEAVFFDFGHPWKTNPDDLAATLERAGLGSARLYQREEHLARSVQTSAKKFHAKRERMVLSNRLFWGPVEALAMLLPKLLSEKAARYVLAAERRLFLGTLHVMNEFSEEVLFVAQKP